MNTKDSIINAVNLLSDLSVRSADTNLLIRLLEEANSLYDNNSQHWAMIPPETLKELQLLNQKIPALRQTFTSSTSTKKIIGNLGLFICDQIESLTEPSDDIIIDTLFNTLRDIVSDYYEDTNDIDEDLGISTGEAISMKRYRSNSAWQQFMKDDRRRFLELSSAK